MEEKWVDIEGYPNYAVSNHGRVINIPRDTFLRPRPNSDGYMRVSLSCEGRVADFYVHRLVAWAFFSGYDPREQVIHYDNDKSNNSTGNLRLRKKPPRPIDHLPIKDLNQKHRRQWGRRIEVVETGAVFRTARDCADYIGGDYGSIYACLRGEQGTHKGFTFQYYDW